MTKRIDLYWAPQGWLADFVGDERVQDAFGTTLIPTAFTARATVEVVQAAIAKLNPGCDVRVQTPPIQLLAMGLASRDEAIRIECERPVPYGC